MEGVQPPAGDQNTPTTIPVWPDLPFESGPHGDPPPAPGGFGAGEAWSATGVGPPEWPPPASRRRRLRPGRIPPLGLLGAALLLALGSGLAGGLIATRLASPNRASPAPVVRPVIASDDSAVDRIEAVAQGLLPVTVQIQAGSGLSEGTGAGVIMSEDGYILTNSHVVDQSDAITVILPSSEAVRGRLVGADPSSDLAVVKIDRRGLPVAVFGRSSEVHVGELAVAVGSPFGLQGSVTAGIVSALHRVVDLGDGERLVDVIQTDASINPGNSGGALANGAGEVIGINTAIATGGIQEANVGVGFAIPVEQALEVAGQLIDGGEVSTPVLGVRGGTTLTPDLAEQRGLTGYTGALIENVDPGSPAERAGIRSGDLVVRIGNSEVHGWDGLVVAVRDVKVGQPLPVVVVRHGTEMTLTVTPAAGRP